MIAPTTDPAPADATLLDLATTHGRVRGRAGPRGVRAYLGIPYAAPPLGARRFRPPEPPARWTGVRDATRFGSASAQYFDPLEAPLDELVDAPAHGPAPTFVGSEDSLTLNVWTRAAPGDRRPLVIWIHGGANWLESSRLEVYHGEALAADGVVFASLNYRLGVFGFLDVSVLGDASYAGSHSLGLMDQCAAIRWLIENAASFGADPDCVTLAGESAGSMDISWLLASGRLPPVRRAVLMSGVAGVPGLATSGDYSYYSEDEGRRQAGALLGSLGVRRIDALLALSTAELLGRLAALVPARHMLFYWDSLFYPRIGDAFAARSPFEALARGQVAGIDLMIGSTAYELGLWLQWDDALDARTPDSLARELPGLPAAAVAPLAEAYQRWFGHGGAGSPGMHLLSDAMFVMPGLAAAALQAAAGGRAYAYQFAWEHRDPRLRALHAADVGFFLGTWRTRGAEALLGPPADASEREQRAALASTMRRALISFAEQGDPNPSPASGPRDRWIPYSSELRPLMVFGPSSRVAFDPLMARRSWWQRHVYGSVLPGAP